MADRTVHPTPEWQWPQGSVWDVFVAVRALGAMSPYLAVYLWSLEMLAMPMKEAGDGR